MFPRRRPALNLKFGLNKIISRGFRHPLAPWRKNAYLERLPVPKTLETVRLEPGNVVHPTGPSTIHSKGEEHVYSVDLDYKIVTPEDELVGLALTGLHPSTSVKAIVSYLKNRAAIRHCWVHSEGVCCIRFQDEDAKEQAKTHLQGLETYPFRIYDMKNRHWFGPRPEDHPPPHTLSLTKEYSEKEPKESPILLLRTLLGLDNTTLAPFRRYGTKGSPVQMVYNKLYAHDKWIWEYYLKFPSTEDANLAFENHAGEKVTVPYAGLSTADKLRFPYGKTLHILLRRTGLDTLPPRQIQETQLYGTIYKPSGATGKRTSTRRSIDAGQGDQRELQHT